MLSERAIGRSVLQALRPFGLAPSASQINRIRGATARPLNADRVVVLRMGLGRDSIAMLGLLAEGKLLVNGRAVAPREIDAVVFTDPGYEWPSTYAVKDRVRAFCDALGVPFIVQDKPPAEGPIGWIAYMQSRAERREILTKNGKKKKLPPEIRPWQRGAPALPTRRKGDLGPLRPHELAVLQHRAATGYYHLWPPILETYQAKSMVIKRADASCTVNHKVSPNRALLRDIAAIRFGVADNKTWSRAVKAGTRPPHLTLLGIAADEIERVERLDKDGGPAYEANAYPLIEARITRTDETPILARHGFADVQKSGCMMCKFQGPDWYWALSQMAPDVYDKVEWYEETAIAAAKADGRPISDALLLGKGPKREPLPTGRLREHVIAWRQKHPEATIAGVLANEYKACGSRYKEGKAKKIEPATVQIRENPRRNPAPRYAIGRAPSCSCGVW